jgi:hypothetical protein
MPGPGCRVNFKLLQVGARSRVRSVKLAFDFLLED